MTDSHLSKFVAPATADDAIVTELVEGVRWTCKVCDHQALLISVTEDQAMQAAYEHAWSEHGLESEPEEVFEAEEPEPTPYVLVAYYYTEASERTRNAIRRAAVHLPECAAVAQARAAAQNSSRQAPAPELSRLTERALRTRLEYGDARRLSVCRRCLPDGVAEGATA